MDICSSPQLIAAYHVFRRLLVPRHPPCALISLTMFTVLAGKPFGLLFQTLLPSVAAQSVVVSNKFLFE